MAMNSKLVLEALKLQPLSEEEKKARHILGRLYGPIATCNEGTRNGRKYNRELWENALNDELFEEKLKTKSLFLELGHPVDREETDMEKVCACIPEMPKIVDGDLYAYVDILDTQNGRLLKTLCDYGFVPGISSRGSGDVDDYTKEVDPNTFFLETWDIVQLPAVKSARLKMCEGLDTKSLKLKKALTESYEKATSEERKVMKESLENLNIDADLEEAVADEIPWSENPDNLAEGHLNEEADNTEVTELPLGDTSNEEAIVEKPADEMPEVATYTISDFIDNFSEYDDSLVIEFAPITIDGKEYSVDSMEFDDSTDGKLVINIDCLQETGDDIAVDDEAEETEAEASAEEVSTEPEENSDEADDIGEEEEVLESLKESIRQKDELEKQVKQLKSAKTVSDTEVKSLKEELDKYKTAFIRMGELAAKAEDYEAEINQLNEQLSQRSCEVESLKAKYSTTLTESADKTKQQLQSLKEQLITARTERDEAEEKLTEQVNAYKKKLKERNDVAIKYRDTCNETINHYISYRASMLGVKPVEIINRLDESYSIDDIDTVCDKILTEGNNISKFPYGFNKESRVRINESKPHNTSDAAYDGGYEVDDDLLELAGLK